MFSHPVAVLGYFAIGLGLAAAFFASGMTYRDGTLTWLIGNALVGVGAFMVLLGVIAQGFLRIEAHLGGIPRMKAAFDASVREATHAAVQSRAEKAPAKGDNDSKPVNASDLQRRLEEMKGKYV